MIRNRYLPQPLDRIACGVVGAAVVATIACEGLRYLEPDSSACFEIDLGDIFEDFSEQLGVRMKVVFWETAIDCNDRNVCFGEFVRKLATELNSEGEGNLSSDSGTWFRKQLHL